MPALWVHVLLIVTVVPLSAQSFSCNAASLLPGIRNEGIAEIAGDILIGCSGGTLGTVSTTDLVVTLGAAVTSTTATGYPEVLLLIDNPAPARQVAGVNVIQATSVNGSQISFQGLHITQPGPSGTRFLTIKNIRVDASQSVLVNGYSLLYASISMSGIQVTNSPLPLSIVAPTLSGSFLRQNGGVALPQCSGENPNLVSSLSGSGVVSFTAQFSTVGNGFLRGRNLGGPISPIAQNEPQAFYGTSVLPQTESGFYNPAFPSAGGMNTAGLASQGTRVMLRFKNVPAGVSLYVTVGSLLAHPSARLIATDQNGAGSYSPVPATGTTPYNQQTYDIAPLAITNGSGLAVWEITSTEGGLSGLVVGVLVAYQANVPTPGVVTVERSYAPLSTDTGAAAGPLPRFSAASVNPGYFNIYSCATGLPDLIVSGVTVPSGGLEGSVVSLSGTIQNSSGAPAGPFRARWSFYDLKTGGPVNSGSTCFFANGLAAGSSVPCAASLAVPATGSQLGLAADSMDDVAESNEGNNLNLSSFLVTRCPATLSPAGINAPAAGGNFSVIVNANGACSWSTSTSGNWVTVMSGSGSGSGAVSLTVSPNSGNARGTTLFVGSQSLLVKQAPLANQPPSIFTVTPAGGSGGSATFVATYDDPNGPDDFALRELRIATGPTGGGACQVRMDQVNNTLSLFLDDGQALSPPLAVDVASAFIENSHCRVLSAGTNIQGAALNFKIEFKPAFSGLKNVYASATDLSGQTTGMVQKGSWSVSTAPPNIAPVVSGFTVASAGSSFVFPFNFSDSDGSGDLDVLNILINDFLDGRHACYIAYSRPLNVLYLVNDAGDALLPGLLLNASGSVSNSQCTIQGEGTLVTLQGNDLTLYLNVSFSSTFGGNKVIYAAARDLAANNSGWQAMGTWGVPPLPAASPGVISIEPSSWTGLSSAEPKTFKVRDAKGWQHLDIVNVLINDFLDGRRSCYLAFSRPSGVLYLVNDTGTALLPPLTLGGSGSVSNGLCTVYAAGSSYGGAGDTLTLTLNLAFSWQFSGHRVSYLAARDIELGNSGWQVMGAWDIRTDAW